MSNIMIRTSSHQDSILLPYRFIDDYMPEANGEFVKIYLYLLRILSQVPASFTLSQAADLFNCTERDILRGLKYWDKEKLLSLELDENGNVSAISLLPIPTPDSTAPDTSISAAPACESVSTASIPAPSQQESAAEQKEKEASGFALSRQRREALSGMEDIQQLLFLAEQYLGTTLSPNSIDRLLYFYDGLKFSTDLIEYLIEYCVSKGHPNMRYIETVAFSWAEKGISTVEDARKEASLFNQEYYSILKALGVTGRSPVESEIRLMDTWRNVYGFSMDIITEACSRTVMQTGQSRIQYADRILSDWYKKGVRSIADIETLDLNHQRKKTQPSRKNNQTNRFNNFPQRSYDFQEYEKRLLNQ
ncbi:MAG: DnaD domain protein [Eubacteriales bacterium]|nr:DnaD domain protein [Eubacteriales bacterium]